MTTVQKVWRLQTKYLKLIATKCNSCGFISYPPKNACPKCGSTDIIEVNLPKKGKVLTYTVIRVPIEGFSHGSPLVIAIIDLGEAKILSQLTDVTPEEVSIGMEVEATIRKTAPTLDGMIPYVIKFKPIKK